MGPFLSMIEAIDNNDQNVPSIPPDVLDFLRVGVASAESMGGRKSDPIMGGWQETFEVRNDAGRRAVLVAWGDNDGWGVIVR